MKLALISDIHSNAVALRAVFEEIGRIGVDQVVCLGDVVSMGAQPRECLELLRTRGCPTIMGNTDDWVLDPKPVLDPDDDQTKIEEMDRWNAEQLDEDDRVFVAGFPPVLRLRLEGEEELLAYHGSPRSFDDWITADTALEVLDRYFSEERAFVCSGGHTHIQMIRRHRGSFIINPGSVGMAYNPFPPDDGTKAAQWAEFAVVAVEGGTTSVELRRVSYDARAWVEILRSSGLPHADWFAESYGF